MSKLLLVYYKCKQVFREEKRNAFIKLIHNLTHENLNLSGESAVYPPKETGNTCLVSTVFGCQFSFYEFKNKLDLE